MQKGGAGPAGNRASHWPILAGAVAFAACGCITGVRSEPSFSKEWHSSYLDQKAQRKREYEGITLAGEDAKVPTKLQMEDGRLKMLMDWAGGFGGDISFDSGDPAFEIEYEVDW